MDPSPTRKVTIKIPTCGRSSPRDPPDTSRDVSVKSPSPPGPGSYASVLGSRVSPSLLDPGSSAPETERKEISKSGEISSYSHASVLGSGASPSLDPRSSAPETKRKDVSKSKEKGGKEEKDQRRKMRKSAETTSKDEDSEGFKTVEKRRKKKKRVRRRDGTIETRERERETGREKENIPAQRPKDTQGSTPALTSGKTVIQMMQKKIPKSSAVAIRGKTEEVSYAEILTLKDKYSAERDWYY